MSRKMIKQSSKQVYIHFLPLSLYESEFVENLWDKVRVENRGEIPFSRYQNNAILPSLWQ